MRTDVRQGDCAVRAGRSGKLVLDQQSQSLLTEARLSAWIEAIKPALLAKLVG
ncbi:hypothetical protein [Thiothrix winogradskyi]|uniref:Uncharacterized protein n=1 Tax=Thiothrix winogradskyi TaxID=96472 RepID=A0ABY3SZI5_9GAMM|nr:hypothetical protein [Thiothrix winogradskyi]UJS24558.1 hypothetical protein L2Y54_00595 [Thiothrix winogradskyi]